MSDNDNNTTWKKQLQKKLFFPKVDITNCNVLFHGRNFYGQPADDQI